MTPESCPFFLTKQLIILRVNSDWYKPSLAPEIMNFSLFTAPVLESLYLHNILLKKSWLFNLLEKSENLKVLSITNCYINEAVNVGTELLPVIPKVSSLTLVETPEFSTDKNTAKLLKNHVLKNGKFEKLKIDPFYPFKTQKEIKNLEGICNSVVEISHFHGLFCNRVLSCLGYQQEFPINGIKIDNSKNGRKFELMFLYKLYPL
uniref:Uncharacterized protein n=1 Tax=Panagrolaimus sp. JU765 TaxID=591449 RepID=A0AC34RHW6_9BILA